MVVSVVIDGAGQQQHARFLDEIVTKSFDPSLVEFGKTHRACLRTDPRKKRRAAGKQVVDDRKVGLDNIEIALG